MFVILVKFRPYALVFPYTVSLGYHTPCYSHKVVPVFRTFSLVFPLVMPPRKVPPKAANDSTQKSSASKGSPTKGKGKKAKKSNVDGSIKNPDFSSKSVPRDSQDQSPQQQGDSSQSAPWFNSLVKDVASVLNKSKHSPSKSKGLVSPPKGVKRRREGSESQSDSESDFYVELDDEDYYNMDEFEPDFDSGKRSSFDPKQKEDFVDFMKDFVESYSTRPSRETRRRASDNGHMPSHKSLRFASEGRRNTANKDKNDNSFSFGCMSSNSPTKKMSGSRSSSHDSALINSLRNDKASNKLAETFLQLAGLSHKDSSDLFRSANAKKSGEHRKASDCAPIPIKWPQELLDRPRGSETSYNELSLAEFMSGNLGLMDLGLSSSSSIESLRHQIQYYRSLCDDVVDYGWPLVREAHKLVLVALEQGQLNPTDIDGLLQKRKIALDRGFRHNKSNEVQQSSTQATTLPSTSSANKPSSSDKTAPGVLLRVCKHFNDGRCNFQKEHQKGAYLWTHICGFCWHRLKQKRAHPECECETKKKDINKQGKNEKGGT